jgi:hypothetical protein
MKHPKPINDGTRFSGQLRHYHRTAVKTRRTWDEWIDGEDAKPGIWRKCLKIAGVVLLLLALGAIVLGLYMVLR